MSKVNAMINRTLLVLAVGVAVLLGPVNVFGAVVAPPVKKGSAGSSPIGHRPANHHLRLPTAPVEHKATVHRPPVKSAVKATVKPTVRPKVAVRRVHARVVHRFSGNVSGVVRDAKGQYVGGASVRLAKAGGRRIRNPHLRHSTSSDSGGGYSMHAVKAGSYRVVASKKGAGKGHSGLAIRSGGVHRVDVNLGGGKTAKKKKHR
jgi:hypothetical protein